MTKYLFNLLTLLIISKSSFGQHNQGTYTGTFNNSNMVAFITNSNGIFVGYFYQSRKTHHTLMGNSIDDKITGQMNPAIFTEYESEVIFRNDSLVIILRDFNLTNFMTIGLKKVNNKTTVNLDKYYSNAKPTNDPKLVGEWELFSDYDLKKQEFRTKKDYNSLILEKNGSLEHLGGTLNIDKSKITVRWYSQDSNLFSNIESKYGSMEHNFGKYTFNGDTLTTSGERYITKYVKKK